MQIHLAVCKVELIEDFKNKHLLLVENNELNREIASEILNEYGFIVDSVENEQEAVNKVFSLNPGDYNLVLMDIQMPIMNGYQGTKTIRASQNKAIVSIPIVAMTANAFEENRKTTHEYGMNGFISKHINIEALIKVLYEVLNNH